MLCVYITLVENFFTMATAAKAGVGGSLSMCKKKLRNFRTNAIPCGEPTLSDVSPLTTCLAWGSEVWLGGDC